MERIVIEVNENSAKRWRDSSTIEKKKIAMAFEEALRREAGQLREPPLGYGRPAEAVLQAHYERVQRSLPDYKKFLLEIGKSVEEKGLTEEILEQLLHDA